MGGVNRRIYPKANTTAQWWETAFSDGTRVSRGTFSRIEKILLHTTETTGWPGYGGGRSAPTLTYHPRRREWRQHNYLDRSARALVDPSSTPVRENRDDVIQIEIIAYADEPKGRSVGGLPVSEISDAALKDLGEFIAWVNQQWGGPPLVAARFIPYPGSYGNSSVRMSSSTYDAFRGVLGHQHCSGNAHGDPGALNVPRIMQHARAFAGATAPAPTPTEPPKEWSDMATEEQIRAAFREEAAAMFVQLMQGKDYQIFVNTTGDPADTRERVPASTLLEAAAKPGITEAQVEAAVRKVIGSIDNPTP